MIIEIAREIRLEPGVRVPDRALGADDLSRGLALLDLEGAQAGSEASRQEGRHRQLHHLAAVQREGAAQNPVDGGRTHRRDREGGFDSLCPQLAPVNEARRLTGRGSERLQQQQIGDRLAEDGEVEVEQLVAEGGIEPAFDLGVPLGRDFGVTGGG